MPGPAKNNLRNNATAVLTKAEGKAVRAPLSRTAQQIPDPEDIAALRELLSNLKRENETMKQDIAILRARLDKFIVDPMTGAVTYPI